MTPTSTCCWWRAPPRGHGEEASSPAALNFPLPSSERLCTVHSAHLVSSPFSLPFSAAHYLDTKFNAHNLFHLQILSSILILFLKTCSVIGRIDRCSPPQSTMIDVHSSGVMLYSQKTGDIRFMLLFPESIASDFWNPFQELSSPHLPNNWTSLIWNTTFWQKLGELSLLN